MCNFKSGIILKSKVELSPNYNNSHSFLLEQLGIEDNMFNAQKVFVRAELIPPENNGLDAPVSDWEFKVDQDIVPDWFENDKLKYETEFRKSVSEWWESITKIINGKRWVILKETEEETYCLLANKLCDAKFDTNKNNYAVSEVRNKLLNHDFTKELIDKYGEYLVPIKLSLTSLDGLKDYGEMNGDFISLMSLYMYREFSEIIPVFDDWYWLATPFSTSKRGYASDVCYVCSDGAVYGRVCSYRRGVRPFCIFKSSIFESI